jgi:hypothetical protein
MYTISSFIVRPNSSQLFVRNEGKRTSLHSGIVHYSYDSVKRNYFSAHSCDEESSHAQFSEGFPDLEAIYSTCDSAEVSY